jgi:hypothetical protein
MGVENVPFGFGLVDSPEASIILKSTNMKEIFKDIPGYEGYYQISNLGNVKSLNYGRTGEERILKPGKSGNGYYQVVLYKEGNKKSIKVHILVAMAFLGHVPNGHKIEVDHKNEIKADNRVENLQLLNTREHRSKYYLTIKTSSKYTGVCWDKIDNKWRANIYIDSKLKFLGYFLEEIEAHLAYQKALEMYNNGDLSFLEPKKYSSQYKGVSWHKQYNKWRAFVIIDGKTKHLGYFKTEIDAHLAYQKALNELIK